MIMTTKIDEINKKLNIVYKIDKQVAVIEEHLRNQNGTIEKIIKDVDTNVKDLYEKVNLNTSFKWKVLGGLTALSVIIPVLTVMMLKAGVV